MSATTPRSLFPTLRSGWNHGRGGACPAKLGLHVGPGVVVALGANKVWKVRGEPVRVQGQPGKD